jgi:hypothetical protein
MRPVLREPVGGASTTLELHVLAIDARGNRETYCSMYQARMPQPAHTPTCHLDFRCIIKVKKSEE